jgi:hypothetical protein
VLAVAITRRRANWVLDADIRGFFDAIDHRWLMKFLEHRIADKRVLRLIQRWLGAGVIEEGTWTAVRRAHRRGRRSRRAACERLPPLRPRPLGPPMEAEAGAR